MGKKDIEDAKKKLEQTEKELREAEIEFNSAKARLESAQDNLKWAKKTPLEKARQEAIQALNSAMEQDKTIGREAYSLVITALSEEPPESKMALVLDVLLRSVTPDEEEE